jgi:hypothetical protein
MRSLLVTRYVVYYTGKKSVINFDGTSCSHRVPGEASCWRTYLGTATAAAQSAVASIPRQQAREKGHKLDLSIAPAGSGLRSDRK